MSVSNQTEGGNGTQLQTIIVQDIVSKCIVQPFKAHIMAAWLKRDDLPDALFWNTRSLSKRDKLLHRKWLLSLKSKCTIAQRLDEQILDSGEAVFQDSEKGKDFGSAVPGDLIEKCAACENQSS